MTGADRTDAPVHRQLLLQGFALILLALLGGILAPFLVNPRMGVGAHTLGVLGGFMLILIGLARPWIALAPTLWKALHVTWFIAAYGNWSCTLLAAATGASRLTPIAAAGTTGSPLAETIVFYFYILVGVTSVIGTALAILGLQRIRRVG
jgi:hydroxylaminobenzene mutase